MTRLILLPGLAGDAVMWQSQLTALASWCPVVADVHMRHASLPDMASALLDDFTGDLVLCGASMGGMIAMEAWRQAPARIRGMALLGTTARPESEDMRQIREAAIELFAQGRLREVIEPNVGFAFHPDQAGDPLLVQSYLDFVLRAGADQLIAQNHAVINRPDARIHLPQVRCPTLVICGEADRLAAPECSQEIASLVPGAQLILVPRCGHMLTMEKPALVNAALQQWLDGLDRVTGG
jgi:pimeloyl-ACP methyl ester carboxylesterase